MPRFGSRRPRSRPVRHARTLRPRKPTSCAITRLQEDPRLEPRVTDITGIRHDLVNRVRQEIHAGTYDTPAKLEAALERMIDRLAQD